MKVVSKDEFFKYIGDKNVRLKLIGNYPFTTQFVEKHTGKVLGITIDKVKNGKEITEYKIRG